MKKPLLLLIGSLTFIVAAGALVFLYTVTPRAENENTSNIQLSLSEACRGKSGNAFKACKYGYDQFNELSSVNEALIECGKEWPRQNSRDCLDGARNAPKKPAASSPASAKANKSNKTLSMEAIVRYCNNRYDDRADSGGAYSACLSEVQGDVKKKCGSNDSCYKSYITADQLYTYDSQHPRNQNQTANSTSSKPGDTQADSPAGNTAQPTQNQGNATNAQARNTPTGPNLKDIQEEQKAADSPKCNGGNGVKLGTGGLGTDCVGDENTNPIFALIKRVSQFAVSLLGLVFVLIVVISGFQYIISRGSPDETKSAKSRLEHAVTGIILLVLMTALLNIIIPGGIL